MKFKPESEIKKINDIIENNKDYFVKIAKETENILKKKTITEKIKERLEENKEYYKNITKSFNENYQKYLNSENKEEIDNFIQEKIK